MAGFGDDSGLGDLGMQVKGGESHGASNGVAEERGGVDGFTTRGRPCVHDLGACDAGGERVTGSEAFAEADNIW